MDNIVGKPQTIKRVNKDLVKNIIKNQGPITKPLISNLTNLSLATVNKIVTQLLDNNEIKLSGICESTGGRRAQSFVINADLECIIAIYYYNNKFLGVLSNLIGEVIYSENFDLLNSDYTSFIDNLFNQIDKLIISSKGCKIRAIGLGIPGAVKNGVVTNIPNIDSLEGINIRSIIESKYNLKVFVENDINLATLGIYQNKYRSIYENIALLYLEDGIGSGIIINQELYVGFSNFAGELNIMGTGEKSGVISNFEKDILYLKNKIKEEEEESLKLQLMTIVSKVILNIVCILNPEAIIIQCEVIKNEEIKFIRDYICKLVGYENCPNLIELESSKEHGLTGIINMCLNETTYQYSLSNKKGRYFSGE